MVVVITVAIFWHGPFWGSIVSFRCSDYVFITGSQDN